MRSGVEHRKKTALVFCAMKANSRSSHWPSAAPDALDFVYISKTDGHLHGARCSIRDGDFHSQVAVE
jgi:hypothetical protein